MSTSIELPPTESELAFFGRALAHVESKSIADWARSEHNRPLFLRAVRVAIAKRGDNRENEIRFATFVMCEAMGF